MEIKDKHVLPTKVLIQKPPQKEKKTDSGIIIPSSADEITSMGTIVIVGASDKNISMPVKPGDKVMFPPRAPIRVDHEGETYWLLNVQDIALYW